MNELTKYDISMESVRTYVYANGDEYEIESPKELFISKTGGHRITDGTTAHSIRGGWIAIKIPKDELEF